MLLRKNLNVEIYIVTKPICDSLYLWYKGKAVSPVFPVSWKEVRQGPYPLQLWIRRNYSCHSKPPTDRHAHCCHTPNLLLTICVLMCHGESVPIFLSPWSHLSINSSHGESVCLDSLSTNGESKVKSTMGEIKSRKRACRQRISPLLHICQRTEHMEWIGSNVTPEQ